MKYRMTAYEDALLLEQCIDYTWVFVHEVKCASMAVARHTGLLMLAWFRRSMPNDEISFGLLPAHYNRNPMDLSDK